jgi:hypothetical protein
MTKLHAPMKTGLRCILVSLLLMLASLLYAQAPPIAEALPSPSGDLRDLEGTWVLAEPAPLRTQSDMNGKALPFKLEGKRILDARVKATYTDGRPYTTAGGRCMPPGQPWQLGLGQTYPFQIYQTQNATVFIFSEYHTVWGVRMNAQHKKAAAREYMGDSIGHWDGDTLVIDIVNYKEPLWFDIDGTPLSADAHLTIRIRRITPKEPQLEIVTTVDDPQYYTAPWSIKRVYAWRPDLAPFQEYDCETEIGKFGAIGIMSQYGYRPEPKASSQ